MYRQRFGLHDHPFPQDASGDSVLPVPGYEKLQRRFEMLKREPGLGVLTGLAGSGKTTGMREQCARLPRPDYRVVYLCDTAVGPLEEVGHFLEMTRDLEGLKKVILL